MMGIPGGPSRRAGENIEPGCRRRDIQPWLWRWAGRTVSRGRAVQLELPEQISLLTQLLSTKRGGVETEPECFLSTGVSIPGLSSRCSEGCGRKSEGGFCVSMRRESDFPIAQHSCLFQPLLSSWSIQTFFDHAENQYCGCEKSVAVRLCGHM